jgi:hypothetical protein
MYFLDLDWLLASQVEKRLFLMVVLPSALIFGSSRTDYNGVVNVDNWLYCKWQGRCDANRLLRVKISTALLQLKSVVFRK